MLQALFHLINISSSHGMKEKSDQFFSVISKPGFKLQTYKTASQHATNSATLCLFLGFCM
jgi:hypothetical protein